jgi:excisionase family DNA binding protein
MSTTQTIVENPTELRPRAYSIVQAAKILGISPVSVRRLIARGLLRPNKTLRHLRISQNEVDRFLAQS